MSSILDNINGNRDGYLIQHFARDHSGSTIHGHTDNSDSHLQLDTVAADINTLLTNPIHERAEIFYNTELSDKTSALLNSVKPWEKDPNYFQHVHINTLALLKMSIHARSGGDIEIMGMLTGKIVKNGIVVMDVYPLPVEGTETRVNAQAEGYEFMVQYKDSLKKAGRNENIVGWYHSHPGYGCWLSGIDVSTQSLNQQFQDPYLAIVIDPHRTLNNGIVEIGAFRTYPVDYSQTNPDKFGSLGSLVVSPDPRKVRNINSKLDKNLKSQKQQTSSSIPEDKVKDFGLHNSKYYSLSIEIFRTETDHLILQNLWNKFWIKNLIGNEQTKENKELKEMFIEEKIDSFNSKISNFGSEEAKSPIMNPSVESRQSTLRGSRKQKLASTGISLPSSPQTNFSLMSAFTQNQLSPFTKANLLSKITVKDRIDNDGSDSEMNDVDSDTDSRQDDDNESITTLPKPDTRERLKKHLKEQFFISTKKESNKINDSLSKLSTPRDPRLLSKNSRLIQQTAAEAGRDLMTLKLQEILFLNE